MNRTVDTSAWIEALIGGPLGTRIAQEIPAQPECVMPTMVQLELAKWLSRNAPDHLASGILAYTAQCLVVDLTSQIALRAADLCIRYKLPTADAIIYATALESDCDLLTCDGHFEGLPGVVYIAKQA